MIPPSTSSSRILRPNSTGLPALNRGITWVCGSNSESSFSPGRHRVILEDPPLGLADALLEPRQDLAEPLGQPPRPRVVAMPPQGLEHPPALGPGPLGRGDEPAVGRLQRLAALLVLAAGDPVQLLRELADGADPAAERLLQPGGGLAEGGPGPPQQPRDDPDAVADQAAVGGEVDVGLDRRGVDAELAAAGHLQRPGQLDHPVVEPLGGSPGRSCWPSGSAWCRRGHVSR